MTNLVVGSRPINIWVKLTLVHTGPVQAILYMQLNPSYSNSVKTIHGLNMGVMQSYVSRPKWQMLWTETKFCLTWYKHSVQTPSKFGNTLRTWSNTITALATALTLDVLIKECADNEKQDTCSILHDASELRYRWLPVACKWNSYAIMCSTAM